MKYIIILIVLIILGVGAYFVLGRPAVEPVLAPIQESGAPSAPEEEVVTPAAMITVTYTDQGFTPAHINIPAGTTVHFVNQSSGDMWVGADEHPTHTQYDGTTKDEHCPNGGAFDQCMRGAPGTFWDFTFTKTGTFDYHNHTESDHTGSVTVR